MPAHLQGQGGHRELVPADASYIECTPVRQLGDHEDQVVLGRLDPAAHAHDEVEMGGQLDHALLRQPQAGFDVADVVALELVADALLAHAPGEFTDQRKRVQEHVVAEVQ